MGVGGGGGGASADVDIFYYYYIFFILKSGNVDKGREGVVRICGQGFLYVLGLLKGSFSLLMHIRWYLAYFYPK